MAEQSYLPYVGHVLFPRRPDDLTSTAQCPACFTPLSGTVCAVCGLDLGNPLASELRAMSLESSAALARRLEVIGRIRYESARAAAAHPAVPAVPATEAPAPADTGLATTPVTAPSPSTAPTMPAQDSAPRRHFGVQVILLIVGVSLLAVGAIFFLVYAFITFGLVWRSIIILAVTVAAFVGSSLLKKRHLGTTAEAIAALAVVFVYLDAFALRANDLFSTAGVDALLYWGVVLVLSAIGFVIWSSVTRLRLPSLVGFAAFAPGVALVVAGVMEPADESVRVFTSFVALALAGLIHPVAGARRLERVIPLSIAVLGLLVATFVSFFLVWDDDWAATVGLAITATVSFVHVAVLLRAHALRGFQYVFAALGGVVAAVCFVPAGFRMNSTEFMVIVPVAAATAIALALELLSRRSTTSHVVVAARVSAAAAAAVAACTAIVALVISFGSVSGTVALAIPRWTEPATLIAEPTTPQIWSVLALAAVSMLLAIFWAMSSLLARRTPVLLWAAATTAVVAAPLASVLWLVVALWFALAAAGIAALIALRDRGIRTLVPIAVGAGASLVLAYATSWASFDLWWIGTLAAIVLLLAARLTTPVPAGRAVLLALAIGVAFAGVGSAFWHLNDTAWGGAGAPVDSTHAVGALATALLAIAALVRGRCVSVLDIRVVFWLSFVATVVTAVISWVLAAVGDRSDLARLVLPEFTTSATLAVGALLALALWIVAPRTAAFAVERVAASVSIAPAVAWVVDSAIRLVDLPTFVSSIAPVRAPVLVAAASLLISTTRASDTARVARDIGIALVAAPALVSSVSTRSSEAWLVLVLGGITVLLVAISRDGLVGSTSPRKHLGWLALALATAGLWWRLGDSQVRHVEPYVLPLAGALLAIAALAWRAARPAPSTTAPLIALGGLLVAILPIAGYSTAGAATRTFAVVALSAALLLLGSFTAGSPALRPYLDVAAIAGAAGVIVGGFGRAVAIAATRETGDYSADLWLAIAFAVVFVAAFGQSRLATGSRVRTGVSQGTSIFAMIAVLGIELFLSTPDAVGATRILAVVGVFCIIHVLAFLIDRVPLSRLLSWVAIGLAAVAAAGGVVIGAVEPLEWASLPIAGALIVTGAIQLARTPQSRSWPWLAPGLGVLPVPSLLTTFVEQPVWRLVGLGVVCVVVVVVGALRGLQAPLIIGSVIVLIHALRTFAPAIRTVYELTEWWVWAVIGGAIVLFLGLTFEKRVRDFRSATTRLSSLR